MADKGLKEALDLIARTIQCNHDIIMVLDRRVEKLEVFLKELKLESLLEGAKRQEPGAVGGFYGPGLTDFVNELKDKVNKKETKNDKQ